MKEVSVVIPAYNEEKDIGRCLESLRKQSFSNFEVIIVDDGSTDNTLEIAKKFKNVKILRGRHKGTGYSRNLGAKKAKGKILVFVDADMHFDRDYIRNLIKPIAKDKRGKVIGATHDYEVATNTDNWISNLWGRIRVSKENAKDVKIFRAIRKDKFLELGGFDSKYGYADDQTFWFKYKIKPAVAPDTTCYHKNPETLESTYKQARWIGASWKERYTIFKVPIIKYLAALGLFVLLPFITLAKATKARKIGFSFSNLLKFYFVKFYGYSKGAYRGVFFGEFSK